MDYIVGITEQELEFLYNRSTGLSNWSELMEEDKLKVIQEFNGNIRSYLHLSKHMATKYQPTLQELPEMLTVEEASQYLRCTAAKLYWLMSDGTLPSHKVKGSRLISRQQIQDYVASTETKKSVRTKAKELADQIAEEGGAD